MREDNRLPFEEQERMEQGEPAMKPSKKFCWLSIAVMLCCLVLPFAVQGAQSTPPASDTDDGSANAPPGQKIGAPQVLEIPPQPVSPPEAAPSPPPPPLVREEIPQSD